MRIACLHIPQFALQCVTRSDPSLRGAPVVVVGSELGSSQFGRSGARAGAPVVQACSRAAWLAGVRVGLSGTAARAMAPDLVVVPMESQRERDTVRAIADAVLAPPFGSAVVDVGGRSGAGGAHLAMYCEVPSKMRGTTYGERLLEKLEALGLTGRIGIADDRFTAWVAASAASDDDAGVASVPRGGSPAYLAPRPLSLLAITPEVQHMLEALGVATLGEFAALPAPSVVSRNRSFEVDYQALARGEGGHALRPYVPDAAIREDIAVGSNGLPAAVALLADRIALRLAGRARRAARLELAILGAAGEKIIPIIVPIAKPDRPAPGELFSELALGTADGGVVHGSAGQTTAEELAEAIAGAITAPRGEHEGKEPGGIEHGGDVWRLRVVVTGEALADAAADAATQDVAAEQAPAIVDTLSLVLSTTGGSLDLALGAAFELPLREVIVGRETAGVLRAERRAAHQRTRRGKQRRRVDSLVQPKLFKNLK
jgi:nucleotidyltransferase/DNA polymerase involved in DNA repair